MMVAININKSVYFLTVYECRINRICDGLSGSRVNEERSRIFFHISSLSS